MENKNFKKLTVEAVKNNEVIQNFMKKDSHTVEEIETVLKEISTKKFLNMIEGVKGVIDMSETILKMDTVVRDYINEVVGEEEISDYEKLLNDEELKESKEQFLDSFNQPEKEVFSFDEVLSDDEMRSSFEFLERFNLISKENLERFKETSKGVEKEQMEELIATGKISNLPDDIKERINRQMNPLDKPSMMKIFNMGIIDREEVDNLLGFFSENLNTDFDYPKIKHFEKDLHKEDENKTEEPAFDFSKFNNSNDTTKKKEEPEFKNNSEANTKKKESLAVVLPVVKEEQTKVSNVKEVKRTPVICRPGTTKVEERNPEFNNIETVVKEEPNQQTNGRLFGKKTMSMFGCY